MPNTLTHYTLLADSFAYPDAGFADRVKRVQAFLDQHYAEAGAALNAFTDFVSHASRS